MARALLREPDLPNRMQAGTATSSLCIHCNQCMVTINVPRAQRHSGEKYRGTHCVLVKPEDDPLRGDTSTP
jgi:hypothetical protein